MTLAAASPINSYVGNGGANTYAFTFPVFLNTQFSVTVTGPTPLFTQYALALGTDYTVSGLNATGVPASTGNIVLVNNGQSWLTGGNLTTGYTLTIQRIVAIAQNASIRNQGDFYQAYIENELDYLTMILQQINYQLGQQISMPPAILPVNFSPVLPNTLASSPGLGIVVNPTGTGFALAGSPGAIVVPVTASQGGTGSGTPLVGAKMMISTAAQKIIEANADASMNSRRITSLLNGVALTDAVNLGQYQQAATNILDDAGFETWQRGSSFAAPATGSYLADRWKNVTDEAAGVTVTKETSVIDTVGLTSMKVVVAGAGASHFWQIAQVVENFADFRGKTVTLSVRVLSSVAGTIRVGVSDSVTGSVYSAYHTGGGGWETLSLTYPVNAATTSLSVVIGMTGTGDKKNGTYYFDSAFLALGSEVLSFVPTNPALDLNRCMRFFQVIGGALNDHIAVAQNNTTTGSQAVYRFPVMMRAAPTFTVNNPTNFNLTTAAGGALALTAFACTVLFPGSARFDLTVAAGLVAGNASLLSAQNANATAFFSADL